MRELRLLNGIIVADGNHPDDANGEPSTGDESSVEPRPHTTTKEGPAHRTDSFDWVDNPDTDNPPQRTSAEDSHTQQQVSNRRQYGREPPILLERTIESSSPSDGTRHGDLSNPTVMAILAHMSVMFGLPFFLLPLWQRNDELSLHHARTAGAIYIFFYGLLALSTVSCGVFFPLAMLGYLPAIVAIYRAVQGKSAGMWGFGGLGEWMFGWVR